MVLIREINFTAKRHSIAADTTQIKRKIKEIYMPGVGMVPVEEPVEVNITIVLTEKEEAEMDADLKKMFDSK